MKSISFLNLNLYFSYIRLQKVTETNIEDEFNLLYTNKSASFAQEARNRVL